MDDMPKKKKPEANGWKILLEWLIWLALVVVIVFIVALHVLDGSTTGALIEEMKEKEQVIEKELEREKGIEREKKKEREKLGKEREKNFLKASKGCAWEDIYKDYKSKYTKKCMPEFVGEKRLDNFHGITIYMIGNSVTRHYSFSLAAVLDSVTNHTPLNRQEEKASCSGILGTSSCDHYSQKTETWIRFLWNNHLGYEVCEDLSRDFCASVSLDTLECISKVIGPGVTEKDILIIGSTATNNKVYCEKSLSSWGSFLELMQNTLNTTTPEYVTRFATDLLRVFPGRILWTSYPTLRMELDDRNNPPETNQLVAKANQIVQSGVMAVNSNRMIYLNLNNYLSEHLQEYADIIHHPGTLSDRVAQWILTVLR